MDAENRKLEARKMRKHELQAIQKLAEKNQKLTTLIM
jgi:hypothetical protein